MSGFVGTPCAVCKEFIVGMSVSIQGQSMHPDCFKCDHCDKPLANEPCTTKDGKYYCPESYNELFAEKCAHCGDALTGQYVIALGEKYHQEHFVCYECQSPFEGGKFVKQTDTEGVDRPYCQPCFTHKYIVDCAGCG